MFFLSGYLGIDEKPTDQEAIVLRELATLPKVSRERLFRQLWGHDPKGGELSWVYHVVASLRKKLLPHFAITCQPVLGYSLLDNRDRLLE